MNFVKRSVSHALISPARRPLRVGGSGGRHVPLAGRPRRERDLGHDHGEGAGEEGHAAAGEGVQPHQVKVS